MSISELNKLKSVAHHYTEEPEFPNGLKSAAEVSEKVGLSEERLIDFANAMCCPHWRIDEGEPLFQLAEVKRWVAKNILKRCDGKSLPIELRIVKDMPIAEGAPESIRHLEGLKQLPADCNPGIYFLIENDEVVYVGQSTNPVSRVPAHRADKTFSHAYMIDAPRELLDNVEGALIRVLKPKFNARNKLDTIIAPVGNKNITDEKILETIGY